MSNLLSLQAAKTVKYGSSVDGISTAEPEQYAKRWDAFFREQYAKIWDVFFTQKAGMHFLQSSTQKGGMHFFMEQYAKGEMHFFMEQYAKKVGCIFHGAVRKR